MSDMVLVLNAGSSSIKYAIFAESGSVPKLHLRGQIEGLHTQTRFEARDAAGTLVSERRWATGEPLGQEGAISWIADFLRERLDQHALVAVGHRVVHGGEEYSAPARVTPELLATLERFIPLAPLHQPHNLRPIRHLLGLAPDVPQVACFDTSFHRTIPPERQAYALPTWVSARGVRR